MEASEAVRVEEAPRNLPYALRLGGNHDGSASLFNLEKFFSTISASHPSGLRKHTKGKAVSDLPSLFSIPLFTFFPYRPRSRVFSRTMSAVARSLPRPQAKNIPCRSRGPGDF